MSRNFDFSQAANKGITVLPDLTLVSPAIGDVLSVKTTAAGIVTTTFTAPGTGGGTAGVTSFNTRTGSITLNSADVTTALTFTPYDAANPNFYQTASQVSTALAAYLPLGGGTMGGPLVLSGLPTTGTEAASKNYVDTKVSAGAVTSFNTRTGPVVLTSLDVTTALTFTPYNATNPAGYQTAAQLTTALAPYLLLAGGTLTGQLVLAGAPATGNAAATKTYVDSAISAIPASPAARNTARLQAQWVTGATVANDTIWLAYDAPYNGVINSLTYFTGNGSFSVAIQVSGGAVAGLTTVLVNSPTPATASAAGGAVFSAGQRITAVITGATGSPTDALLSLAVTWS